MKDYLKGNAPPKTAAFQHNKSSIIIIRKQTKKYIVPLGETRSLRCGAGARKVVLTQK